MKGKDPAVSEVGNSGPDSAMSPEDWRSKGEVIPLVSNGLTPVLYSIGNGQQKQSNLGVYCVDLRADLGEEEVYFKRGISGADMHHVRPLSSTVLAVVFVSVLQVAMEDQGAEAMEMKDDDTRKVTHPGLPASPALTPAEAGAAATGAVVGRSPPMDGGDVEVGDPLATVAAKCTAQAAPVGRGGGADRPTQATDDPQV